MPDGTLKMEEPLKKTNWIELGDRVKDSVTGFEGVVVAKNTDVLGKHIHVRVEVQPEEMRKLKDNSYLMESKWFDETRLLANRRNVNE